MTDNRVARVTLSDTVRNIASRDLPATAVLHMNALLRVIEAQAPDKNSGVVRQLSVVTLQEPDSLLLAAVGSLAPTRAGGFYVAELSLSRVIQYDRNGALVAAIGRKGTGPGEFQAPGAMTLIQDSLLVVNDAGQRGLALFNAHTRRYIRLVRNDGVPTAMLAWRDTLFMGLVIPKTERMTSLAKWPLSRDTVRYFGTLPAEYAQSKQIAQTLPMAVMTRWRDTLLIGFAGHQDLFLASADGRVRDTVNIPARVRRGVPRDLVDQYTRPQTRWC